MKSLISISVAVALISLPGLACAQSTTGGATLSVQRGLSISTVSPMRIQSTEREAGLSVTGSELVDAPAMIQITGDPGRVYRIRLPQTSGADGLAVIEDLEIWSANAGDISEVRVARLDMSGQDLLRVSGRLRLQLGGDGEPITALPLSIDYE